MNMIVLKRTRKRPIPGDMFVFKMAQLPDRFYWGRVIKTGTRLGTIEVNDFPMLYIYNVWTPESSPPPLEQLLPVNLLIPPLATNFRPWTMGYFQPAGNRPLLPGEVLPVHCFKFPGFESRYVDEYRVRLEKRIEPCGICGIGSFRTVDDKVSKALGIPRSPD